MSLISTKVLPANCCPEHKGGEFEVFGAPAELMKPVTINRENNSIIVPADSSEFWNLGWKGVIIIQCQKCRLITVHKPTVTSWGMHEWHTVKPKGWRVRVRFEWPSFLPGSNWSIDNIKKVRYRTWLKRRIGVPVVIDLMKEEMISLYKSHIVEIFSSYVIGSRKIFIRELVALQKYLIDQLPEYTERLLMNFGDMKNQVIGGLLSIRENLWKSEGINSKVLESIRGEVENLLKYPLKVPLPSLSHKAKKEKVAK